MSFRRTKQDLWWVKAYLVMEFTAFRLVVLFIMSIGARNAMVFGSLMGDLVRIIDRTHTRRTYEHLRKAYGNELSEDRVREIAHGVYRHFGQVLVEMLYFRRLVRPSNWQRFLVYENENYLTEALAKGKGVLFCGGHMGNWEITGCITSMRGFKVASIYRPLDNPLMDQFLVSFRRQTGQKIIEKWGAMKETVRVLRQNYTMGMLVDQDARKNGIFVNFFGIPSSTLPMPGQLALKFGCAVLPFYSYRIDKREMKYVFGFYPPVDVDKLSGTYEEKVAQITQEIASRMEETIRQHPEQWLWMHRRWKTKHIEQP